MKRLRRLICRVFGHEWTLEAAVRMGHLDPVPEEMLVYLRTQTPFLWHEERAQNIWVERRDERWVCLRCGAQVPLGQSEAAA